MLLPFSWLYRFGIWIFHKLYDLKWRRTYTPGIPTICVGNLSVGGTGKTPMVEHIVSRLLPSTKLAVVSRGYGRKTQGLVWADEMATAADIGDEPLQFHKKFPALTVVVAEKRAAAIEALMAQRPETDLIILDDAFQHRAVKASYNLLLTAYNDLFVNDWYLPAGSLRDLKSSYQRAQSIVVTKCPAQLSLSEKESIERLIQPLPHQHLFFASFSYGAPYHLFSGVVMPVQDMKDGILITGIANPATLVEYLEQRHVKLDHLSFPDHHEFSGADIERIINRFAQCAFADKIMLTTEKDAMRLRQWPQLAAFSIFVIPVAHQILFSEADQFDRELLNLINAPQQGGRNVDI
ncbi:tetraacyldisaccharide 4'-kinase [Niabella insulamsoli]|uniref:tetraacyldisaccharide 4'-kinase n=1 Tax=Niabella insulamsoli TaxID=3144874 RepID=UPI0031FCF9BF